MILIKQYAKDKWEQFWKEKPGINGYLGYALYQGYPYMLWSFGLCPLTC